MWKQTAVAEASDAEPQLNVSVIRDVTQYYFTFLFKHASEEQSWTQAVDTSKASFSFISQFCRNGADIVKDESGKGKGIHSFAFGAVVYNYITGDLFMLKQQELWLPCEALSQKILGSDQLALCGLCQSYERAHISRLRNFELSEEIRLISQ